MSSPVVVLGMHRSGTSCLAGCLEELGLSLGEVVTEAPHNKKGNRENPRFWPVHDAVLHRVGASWDNPPTEAVAWTAQEKADLKSVLTDYDVLPAPWGFKDPRATVLLDGWFEVLPDIRLIGSIRHPTAVAGSLKARNGFEDERSFQIWKTYNLAMLRWHDQAHFDVLDYNDPAFDAKVLASAKALGLAAEASMTFREDELNHQAVAELEPGEIADLWARLRGIAL